MGDDFTWPRGEPIPNQRTVWLRWQRDPYQTGCDGHERDPRHAFLTGEQTHAGHGYLR
jgi:hypothetical protein